MEREGEWTHGVREGTIDLSVLEYLARFFSLVPEVYRAARSDEAIRPLEMDYDYEGFGRILEVFDPETIP